MLHAQGRGKVCAAVKLPLLRLLLMLRAGVLSGLEAWSVELEAPLEEVLALVTQQPTLLLAKVRPAPPITLNCLFAAPSPRLPWHGCACLKAACRR